MKRLLTALLALVMVFSLAACSQQDNNAQGDANNTSNVTEDNKTQGETNKEEEKKEEAPAPSVGFSEETGDGLKITTLSENTNTGHEELTAEFGFSVLIEYGDARIIFDTAKQGDFIEHAEQLGVDIGSCNVLALSHAHYDHCGGLMKYLDTFGGDGKTLFIKDSFFDGSAEKYYDDIVGQKMDFTDGNPGYFNIGIDFEESDVLSKGMEIHYIDSNEIELAPGIKLYGSFVRNPLDPKMLVKNENGDFVIDTFDEEIAVSIETSKGIVVISGCSHTGIVNIVNAIKERTGKEVYAVIGGFHLLDATEKQIQDCIDLFKGMNIAHLGMAHCTGEMAKQMFLEQLPENSYLNSTGSIFEMK